LTLDFETDEESTSSADDTEVTTGENSRHKPVKESVLIKSGAAWRKQLEKWQAEAAAGGFEITPPAHYSQQWAPGTLEKLFGSNVANPVIPVRRKRTFDDESRLMELLAAEHDDEEPDDGAKEGSGDDFKE
jgi:hypothetical protein